MIRSATAGGLLAALLVAPAAFAHCDPPNQCVYAPYHHCPGNQPCGELGAAAGAAQRLGAAQQSAEIRTVIFRPFKKPATDETGAKTLAPSDAVAVPPLDIRPGTTGAVSAFPAGAPPLTPAQFAQQSVVPSTTREVATVQRGVFDATRQLAEISAAERRAIGNSSAASARVFEVMNLRLGLAYRQLERYDGLLRQTRDAAQAGTIQLSADGLQDVQTALRATGTLVVDTDERSR